MRTIIYNHKFPEKIKNMLYDYKDMVNYLLNYAIDNKINNAYDPRGTSKKCSGCGSNVYNPTWKVSYCDKCKIFMHRDGNASINILNAGHEFLWRVPLPPNVVTSLISSWTLTDVQNKNMDKFI